MHGAVLTDLLDHLLLLLLADGAQFQVILIVDVVAPRSVWADPGGVVRAAQIGLVFRVAAGVTYLVVPVGELTLGPVLAEAGLLELAAELGLVTIHVHRLHHVVLGQADGQTGAPTQYVVRLYGGHRCGLRADSRLLRLQLLDQGGDRSRCVE